MVDLGSGSESGVYNVVILWASQAGSLQHHLECQAGIIVYIQPQREPSSSGGVGGRTVIVVGNCDRGVMSMPLTLCVRHSKRAFAGGRVRARSSEGFSKLLIQF